MINARSLRDLAGFLRATGWSLIWGLNLGSGGIEQAVEEARAVASTAGDHLLAFEIGNEPDLFVHEGTGSNTPTRIIWRSIGAIKQRSARRYRVRRLPGRMLPLLLIG